MDSSCAMLAAIVKDDSLTFDAGLDADFEAALLTSSEVCLGLSCGLFAVDLRLLEDVSSGSLGLETVSVTFDLAISE